MSEKQTNFRKLSEAVISELKSLGYMDSPLANYRRFYARIGSFMNDRSIDEYSPEVGKDFVVKHYPFDTERRRIVLSMIRHLDDHLNDLPYRYHRTMKTFEISEFLDWLETERKCSISTRNHRLSVLNAFSEYAQNRDFEAASVFRASLLKIPQKKGMPVKRSFFTREEIKLLLSFPNSRTAIGKRDRTLLCFMYASGARAQEACDLTVGDVTFYPNKATVKLLGKGQKARTISIPADAAAILKGYIKYRKLQDKFDRHIFSSQTHEKMTVSCIEEIFFKYVEKGKAEYSTNFREKAIPHIQCDTQQLHIC